jgi:hypothetical protein
VDIATYNVSAKYIIIVWKGEKCPSYVRLVDQLAVTKDNDDLEEVHSMIFQEQLQVLEHFRMHSYFMKAPPLLLTRDGYLTQGLHFG